LDIETSAAGCRREVVAAPLAELAGQVSDIPFDDRSRPDHPALTGRLPGRQNDPDRVVLHSLRSSPTITLRSREAGVNPAQSRYGDHRSWAMEVRSPTPRWMLDLREKG